MSTVADVEAQLAGKVTDAEVDAVITASRTQIQSMSPAGRLGWLGKALGELGLDGACLDPARKLAATERELGRRQTGRQMEAQRRRQAALAALVDDPSGDLDPPVAAFAAESPWLDTPAGRERPPAVELLRNARRTVESKIDGQLMNAGTVIFGMVKAKAAEVVAEVAALGPLPDVWSVSNPAEELAKHRQHRSSWGVLVAARQDFDLCHTIADLYRDYLGYSADRVDGAPSWSVMWRNWQRVLPDVLWPTIRKPLKLAYAVQHDFGAGLWTPDEIVVKPEDKSFGARLRNLGSAVGSGWGQSSPPT